MLFCKEGGEGVGWKQWGRGGRGVILENASFDSHCHISQQMSDHNMFPRLKQMCLCHNVKGLNGERQTSLKLYCVISLHNSGFVDNTEEILLAILIYRRQHKKKKKKK